MSYLAKVGSFNLDTTRTVGQTQSVTGVGFQPKIVLFWWSGSTATGDNVGGGTYNIGFGAAISSSSRLNVVGFSVDDAATSNTGVSQYKTDCIRCNTAPAVVDGIADFYSMDADGFTLVMDDQFSNAYRISYLALGGDDLTDVYMGSGSTPTSTGNYDVTGVGFQPDALLIAATHISGRWRREGYCQFFTRLGHQRQQSGCHIRSRPGQPGHIQHRQLRL